jgi:iron complex outermembrane recepter protein
MITKLALRFAVSAVALTAAGAVQAQSVQPTTDAPAQEASTVDEIIVTAQRRSERLADVPIAVSAYGAETIKDARITTVGEVAARTPNFTNTSASAGDPHLFIRGIGSTEDAAAGDRSIGVFIDDVYVGRGGAMLADFFDVERLEVLRGPQGTLYGRNVVGGSVNIVTQKPTYVRDAAVEGTVGSYDLWEARAFINVPFSDTAAGRLAVTHSEHDGYALNTFTGHRVEAADVTSVRGSLRFDPNEDVQVVLRANASRNRDFGGARDPNPCGPSCLARFSNPALGDIAYDPDPRRVQGQRDGYFDRDLYGTSANIGWKSPIGQITSITAFMKSDWELLDEASGLPDILKVQATNFIVEDADQFSQEFRLASDLLDGKLNWSVGAYYFRENVAREESTDRCISSTAAASCVRTYLNYIQDVTSQSIAGYAEVEYRPFEPLTLIAGVRYSRDDKDLGIEGRNLGGPIPASSSRQPWAPFDVDQDWDAVTPRLVIRYKLDDRNMVYGTISRGYKAGGFQGQADNGASAAVPYDPEFVTNYEVGGKFSVFERRLQANVAAFIMKYEDLQVRQRILLDPADPTTVINVTSNAAQATIQGLEVELTARPTQGLEVWAAGALLDATYDEFVSGTTDLSGSHLPRSPEQALTVGGKLTLPIGSVGEIALRAEAQYKSEIFFDPDNTVVPGREPGHTLVDLGATYSPAHGDWEVSVWGKNVSDELYRENTLIVGDSGYSRYGAPRTYGLTLRYRF